MTHEPLTIRVICHECSYPMTYNTREKTVELRVDPITKKAFLIH